MSKFKRGDILMRNGQDGEFYTISVLKVLKADYKLMYADGKTMTFKHHFIEGRYHLRNILDDWFEHVEV